MADQGNMIGIIGLIVGVVVLFAGFFSGPAALSRADARAAASGTAVGYWTP
jgi:hypothetical protein